MFGREARKFTSLDKDSEAAERDGKTFFWLKLGKWFEGLAWGAFRAWTINSCGEGIHINVESNWQS